MRMIIAYDRQKLSSDFIAHHLASLIHEVHKQNANGTVRNSSIVVWRNYKKGLKKSGRSMNSYADGIRNSNHPSIPILASGHDINTIADVLSLHAYKLMETFIRVDNIEIDKYQINRELIKHLPSKPDEELK